ncbi:hypothetical protein SDC9_207233 [bioreactor metagenome]|uniref:Uncharacterized protein n=1 Tax=bioreactor metagenome TaxID=1076179 RepID=A0A645J8R7_9ZZZZ
MFLNLPVVIHSNCLYGFLIFGFIKYVFGIHTPIEPNNAIALYGNIYGIIITTLTSAAANTYQQFSTEEVLLGKEIR